MRPVLPEADTKPRPTQQLKYRAKGLGVEFLQWTYKYIELFSCWVFLIEGESRRKAIYALLSFQIIML